MKRRERIIIALDVGDAESCKKLLDRLYPAIKIFKIGSQLFTAAGREAVNMVKRKGAGCFLDLKFHDIPSTVGKAAAAATSLGADIFNVHASGGVDMMKAAVELSKETASRLRIKEPVILGVTVLTSMIGTEEEVVSLAQSAKKAGLDGVVASASEIEMIKKACGKSFLVVTPGIRPSWADKDDQKRVATPKEAFDRGADYIVIGRAITNEQDPKAAAERIIGEIE